MTSTCHTADFRLVRRSTPASSGGPLPGPVRAVRPSRPPAGRRRRLVVISEVVVLVAVVAVVAGEAPRLLSTAASDLARLADPSPSALAAAAGFEAVSMVAFAQVPRWLLRSAGVRIRLADATALTLTANGMSILLPAGTVSSTVWSAHQYSRRGASPAEATWAVVASGFASTVTLLAVAIAGGLAAGVLGGRTAAAATAVLVLGASGVVVLTHRAESLTALVARRSVDGSGSPGRLRRALRRLVGLVGEAAGQRAGWSTGSAVLAVATANWLADAACLAGAFWVLRLPVPWGAVLLAYAAGQLAGALVPLPGGLGAVETGTIGVLLALGTPAAPAIAAVAVYRLLGYLGPLLASLPAYGWVRRTVGRGSGTDVGEGADGGTPIGLAA